MSILSTNTRLVKVGQEYSAGSGISIDDHVISVTGEFGKTYSAGDNVSIYEQDEQLYISSKDWNDDIANASANAYNAATAEIPDPFDASYISGQIDNKLDSTAFTNWQNSQYATDLQTIEGQITTKLDESAFSSVSGSFLTAINIPESASWEEATQAYEQNSGTYLTAHQSLDGYATVEDVESATSALFPNSAVYPLANSIMSSVTSNTVSYSMKPSADAIYASYNELYNVNQVRGSGFAINPLNLYLSGAITATTGGLTANGLTANADSAYGGFSANGITAGTREGFAIQGPGESFSESYGNGFLFSSVNTGIGTARLTVAGYNTFVQMSSPKFEAKNISGAGFSIEGSGARGYDHNGNVIWDTSKPAKLIGWSNYQGTAIDPRANGINGGIIATVFPDMIPQDMQISSAPYSYMNGFGFFASNTNGTTLSFDTTQSTIGLLHTGMSATAAMNPGDVFYRKYNSTLSANEVWSLTGSVQKREIECDSATSAITAIAGSAIGGGGGVPQSAFDELKQSYDALSSLFATYSGQWLLPNEGEV